MHVDDIVLVDLTGEGTSTHIEVERGFGI